MSNRPPSPAVEPDIRSVFEAYADWSTGPSGSVVLRDLKRRLDVPSYIVGIDSLELAHREGRRSVLLDILAAIEAGHRVKSMPPEPEVEQETLTF